MKHHHRNNYISGTEARISSKSSAKPAAQINKKEAQMHTAFRVKTAVHSSKLEIDVPGLELLLGREVEVLIIANGIVEDGSKPSEGRQNSSHAAGSIILDDEALRYILSDRQR
ncbi:MAG: hypothetical protein FWE57_09610 [Chitinispirillia bacterium]|nr:hypothetical protein [Chitinispirillia bacterium]